MKIRHICAWEGCKETTPFEEPLPEGWRWLLLWPDAEPVRHQPEFLEVISIADRDCVLCPVHADRLDGYLLKVIDPKKRGTRQ